MTQPDSDRSHDTAASIDPAHLADLARFAAAHGVAELHWQEGERAVLLKIAAPATPMPQPPAPPAARIEPVRAPGFGHLDIPESCPPKTARPVKQGEILAHVQLGPLRLPVRAPSGGVLMAHDLRQGAVTGFGDVLFEITRDEAAGS